MRSAVVWLAAFAANLLALAPDQALEDTAELLACALGFGNAHPPGYPLHALACRLAMALPAGSPGFRGNLLSAAATATAALAAFRVASDLARRLGGAATAAGLGAAAAFAASPTVWWHATMADKYPLFAMLFALAVAALWRLYAERDPRSMLAASFWSGAALAQHMMGLYLLPALLWAAWRTRGLRTAVLATVFLLLPFSVKLVYPPVRSAADPVVNWGVPDRAGRLVRYLAAAGFSDRFYAPTQASEMVARSAAHVARVARDESGPELVLAAVGLAALWGGVRAAAVGALSIAAANLAIAMPFRDALIFGQMYIPAIWLASVLAGAGAGALAARWRPAAAAAVLLAVFPAWRAAPAAFQSRAYAAPDHFRNESALLPPRAFVLAQQEACLAPLWYARESDPVWRGLELATFGDLNPAGPGRARLDRHLGARAALLRGYDDGEPALARMSAMRGRVFLGLKAMPLPSRGMRWHGLLCTADPGALAGWSLDPATERLWRAVRWRGLANPRTLRERNLADAYLEALRGQVRSAAAAGDSAGARRLAALGRRLGAGVIKAPDEERRELVAAFRGDHRAAASALTRTGFDLVREERFREAAEAWADSLALHSGGTMAMNGLGELALTEERSADALGWFRRSCAAAPAPGCRDGITRARSAADAAAALPALERRADAAPRDAAALCDLGNAYWRLGRLRAAEVTYQRSLAADPGYARGWCNLGSALADQGGVREAVRAYHRSLRADPGWVPAMVNLGAVLARAGNRKEARLWLERALAAKPGDPEAAAMLRDVGQ